MTEADESKISKTNAVTIIAENTLRGFVEGVKKTSRQYVTWPVWIKRTYMVSAILWDLISSIRYHMKFAETNGVDETKLGTSDQL